jgi:HEAT repeat protein
LEQLGALLPPEKIEMVLSFLVAREALGDAREEVRQRMLAAGLVLIDSQGVGRLEGILLILNSYLDAPAKSSGTHDRIREAAVILLGAAARHLSATDNRIDAIVDKLLITLKTPSESVQTAVCDCLPPLIRVRPQRVSELVNRLMTDLKGSPKYAERRGAAFGLAGVVAGSGIATLHTSNILIDLTAAITNRKDPKQREGSLFAYEALLYSLNRLFEPFIHQVLPQLLITYGDSAAEVRTATSDTSKMIMRTISGHCVKEILPDLLAGLEESQWRSKKGSIEMLGAMAYLAPRQLSISLPMVVPKLTGVLTDSHTQVRTAANSSLLKFGEVISNPEVQDMVPILLKALGDPNKYTENALDKLLSTAFIHYIDGPSLALVYIFCDCSDGQVLPILTRGLKERNPSSRRKSARILGSLGNLTDQRDLVTYLTELLPPLRDILSDAIPENRASAATSLGLLVEKLGEDNFPDLIKSLLDDLKVEAGGIGRLGSAQALSEILSALGLHRLEDVLPEILASTESPKFAVREAFINLLVYLPATFGNRFQPYLAQTVPRILAGLADDVDVVREGASCIC